MSAVLLSVVSLLNDPETPDQPIVIGDENNARVEKILETLVKKKRENTEGKRENAEHERSDHDTTAKEKAAAPTKSDIQ